MAKASSSGFWVIACNIIVEADVQTYPMFVSKAEGGGLGITHGAAYRFAPAAVLTAAAAIATAPQHLQPFCHCCHFEANGDDPSVSASL